MNNAQPATLAEYNARNDAHIAAFRESIAEYSRRTANQPTREITMDEMLVILRAEKDAEGNRMIDKYFNEAGVGNVTVELPDGQWRCYALAPRS